VKVDGSKVRIALAGVIIGVLLGAYIGFSASPSTTQMISGGIYPGAPSYTIWKEGSNYFAKNSNGEIEFSGTNASQVINNAINSLTSGGKIFLRAGNYILDTPIQLRSGITLEGEILAGDNTLGTYIYMEANSQCNAIERLKPGSWSKITVRNLVIDGNKANNPDLGIDGHQCGIYLGATTFWVIENVHVLRTTRQGIYIASSSYGQLINCITTDVGREGIVLDATVYSSIINCVSKNNGYHGLDISTNTNMTFHVTVIGGQFFSNDFYGISIRNYGDNSFTDQVSIVGAYTFQNGLDGIYINNAMGISLSNVHSYYNNRSGILLSNAYHITITGTHCYDNDYANSEATYGNGIHLQNSSYCIITACQSGNIYGTTQNYGIREWSSSGTCANNTITACHCLDNSVMGISVGTSTHVNLCWNGTNWIS